MEKLEDMMDGLLQAIDVVEQLSPKLSKEENVVNNIRTLIQKFPDLMVYRPDEHKQYEVFCCSSTINSNVDSYEYVIDDQSHLIDVWPYTRINDIKVYSNPPCFEVGQVNTNGFGIVPNNYWVDVLEDNNISKLVIRQIRSYLKSKPPINYTE